MPKTKFQSWNIVAALVLFLLLGLHMTIMHTNVIHAFAPHGDDNDALQNVLFRDGKLFFTFTYVLLLAAGLYHGLFGLRTMLLERISAPAGQRILTFILVILGAGLFAFGAWAAIVAHGIALAARG